MQMHCPGIPMDLPLGKVLHKMKRRLPLFDTEADIAMSELLQQSPVAHEKEQEYNYGVEQQKDQRLKEIMDFLQSDAIPEDPHRASGLLGWQGPVVAPL